MTKSKLTDEERFLSYVKKTDACWIWVGGKYPYGYGSFWFRQKRDYAHRVSYLLYKGEIPEGLYVCHKCDNPPCCNPDHLFLGTNQENQLDNVRKGRHHYQVGEDRYNSKFTANDIIYIRNLRKDGWTLQSIADLYGIGFQYVSKIVNRKVWRHV